MERASSSENTFIRPRGSATKNPAVSALQDLLFYQLIGLGFFMKNINSFKQNDYEINKKITRLLYLTNKGINFDILVMVEAIQEAFRLKNKAENMLKFLSKTNNIKLPKIPTASKLEPGETLSQMVSQANVINIQKSIKISNFKIFAIKEIIRESLTSSSNYLELTKIQSKISNNIYHYIYNILNFLCSENPKENEAKKIALQTGELQTETLELFLTSCEKTYGVAQRNKIPTNSQKGHAILVAGEDFGFLVKLLQETSNKDINIYTYGGLNYAHAFPEIRKYKNLIGIYKSKYDNFAADIENFPGVVVLTTGNLEELTDIYRGRVYSTEDISLLGISKLDKNNIKPLINSAYDAVGFEDNEEYSSLEIGFSRKDLEMYTEKYTDLIKKNELKNLYIILGCNEFFNKTNKIIKNKKENIVVTIDCNSLLADYKNNMQLLNLGQFANLYNLIRLIFSISGKTQKNINELPLNIIINLHNSETVSGLLMFLSLGFKNIKINSDLPNYLSDNLINIFQKDFNLQYLSLNNIPNINIKNKQA